jgi:predicted Zn-dependent peptidase
VRVDFKETTLKNGLRVITVEDHSAPVVAVSITYNVGSRNERQGRTGFAHLFEHMMFKGSENVGSGEHFLLVFNNGGNMNGTTNEDRTNYFEILPARQPTQRRPGRTTPRH